MENYPLSREQHGALNMIDNNNLSLIQYLDKINLSSTLSYSALANARKGKKTILIIEDPSIQKLLEDKLAQLQVQNLVLSLKDDDFLNESSLAKIRTLFKNKNTDIDLEGIRILHQFDRQNERINQAFEVLTNKIFGERRWIDLHLLQPRTYKNFTVESLPISVALTQQEFWHLRGKIEEAKALYTFSTQVNDNILEKFNIKIESEEKILALREHLIRFKVRLVDLQEKLDQEINKYKDRIWNKLEEEYLSISEFLENFDLQSALYTNDKEDKSSTFLFGKKTDKEEVYFKPIISSIKKIKESVLLEIPENQEYNTFDELNNLKATILSQIGHWKTRGEEIIVRMLRSLNKNNSDSDVLRNVDQEINVLYQEINNSNLFKDRFENTSMNTLHQYHAIDSLLRHVKVLLSYLKENKNIVIWQSFINQLEPSARQIIELLKNYELMEWIPIFEKWYLEKLIHKHGHPDIHNIASLLYAQAKIADNIDKYHTDFINKKLAQKRQKLVELCRTRSKKLYQELFKKKGVSHLRAFDIIWSEKDMLPSFFPIMIISAKLLRSNRLLKDGKWDLVFCEGTEIFNHVEKYNFLEQKTCFFAPLAESFKIGNDLGIKMDDQQKSKKLLIHEYNYHAPIKELPVSDRLRAAKKLAKILLSLNQSVRIFQLKNANILSLAGQVNNACIVNHFDDSGIKEIVPDGNLYEAVTECILESDREQFIIFEDHLLNIMQYPYYLWQVKAIKAFQSAGFKKINIPSLVCRNNPEKVITVVAQHIEKKSEDSVPLMAEA